MAKVFLSYSSKDRERVQPLAWLLEHAGHDVWWDRHISGGAQFSQEIEQALAAAEIVIVCWSENSAGSAWVRDEATEGRERGKLIPILLDDRPPPLGFRQIQSIDFSLWRDRNRPRNFQELLGAMDRLVPKAAPAPPPAPAPSPPPPAPPPQPPLAPPPAAPPPPPPQSWDTQRSGFHGGDSAQPAPPGPYAPPPYDPAPLRATGNTGLILGAVFGGLALLVVIVVVVIAMSNRSPSDGRVYLDGTWRAAWVWGDTQHVATIVIRDSTAQTEVQVGNEYRAAETCTVTPNGPNVRIACSNTRVLDSTTQTYNADVFTLTLTGQDSMRGSVTDTAGEGGTAVEVTRVSR